MVQRKGFVIPFIALLLGALAMTFSLIANAKRIKAEDVVTKNGYCFYPSSPSPALGLVAALFLFSEQIVISAATFCFCCCGVRCSARCTYITSLLFFICSWATFVIAFVGLVFSAILYNNIIEKSYAGNNARDCNLVNQNLFLGAAVWSVITTALGVLSYAFGVCDPANTSNNSQGRDVDREQGIAMGVPARMQQQPPKEQSTSSML